MMGSSDPQEMDIGAIGNQIVLYGKTDSAIDLEKFYFKNMQNITCKDVTDDIDIRATTEKAKIENFIDIFYNLAADKEDRIGHEVDMTAKDYVGYFGGFLWLKDSGHHYKFIEVLNTRVSHIVPLFT
jgi:hypothetical protein